MAFSAVPFALQNASHSAALYRQAVSSLVPVGGGKSTPNDVTVQQTGTPSMAVTISTGRLWIPGTEVSNVSGGNFSTQAMYYAENEATVTVTVTPSDSTNPRVDVLYVAAQDSQYSGSYDRVSPTFIATGAPVPGAVYPSYAPAIPNNALAIAYIIVRAGSTSILNSDITNLPIAIFSTTPATSYAPVLTAPTNPNMGSAATTLGTYSITGTTMTGQFFLSFGGTGISGGSGAFQVGLPTGFSYTSLNPYIPVGNFAVNANGPYLQGILRQGGDLSYMNMYWQSAPATVSAVSSSSFAWGSGMNLAGSFTVTIA